jgi:disease resistance protein RPM1
MRPLGEDDSKRLFFSRIFGSGGACSDVFEEFSVDILKRCGGLPLAIISIASLLAGQSKMVWEYVCSSLGSMFEGNLCLDDMKKILDLSYRNLPHHLKTCLLYLGMYPEDSVIKKDDLVRQWIAEGFVSRIQGLDAEDVAESYFNELINMSMIQPANTDYNDEVLSCKVHDIMLDLIRFKSAEENFFDVIDDPQATMISHKKIRRASIHYSGAGHDVILTTTNGSACQARSVVAFTRALLPSFHEFKYVRVLFLEFKEARLHKMDLISICALFLLRYLKIVTDGDLELPIQFWGLQYLDTLVLEKPMKLYIPSDIVRLRRLLHLVVPGGMVFQDGIGSLKFLRTLQEFDFSRSSLESFKSLGKLTNLRHLRLDYDRMDMDDMTMDALHTLLEGLSHCSSLKSFFINSHMRYFDWLSTLSGFPRHIQRLHLWGLWFPRIPNWIAQLRNLYNLELVVREVMPKDDGIGILARLPSLVHLWLVIKQDPEEAVVIPSTCNTFVAFPALKHLKFCCPKPHLALEAGALPRLHNLELRLTVAGWQEVIKWLEPAGMKHLPAGLKRMFLYCHRNLAGKATLSTLKSVFHMHHPDVDLWLPSTN